MMIAGGSLKVWASMFAALVLAAVCAFMAFSPGAEAQDLGCKGDVVLDAGHGGSDPGALNSKYGLKEKEQNLDVAQRLKTLLVADGYRVCMTRTTNSETLSNSDRYTYANTTGAKVLVSIHMNASSNSAADYTTTLYGKWRKDKELAQTVFGSLSTLPAASGSGTIATRAPYSFASGVLLKSNMPAIIAETVFISSDAEGRLLSDGTGARQRQIAEKLEIGIENYLSAP